MSKIQIRRGVFETNSSSTHALCIRRGDEVSKQDVMEKYKGQKFYVEGGEYGWEYGVICDPSCKLDYIFATMTYLTDVEAVEADMAKIRDILSGVGVDVEFMYSKVSKMTNSKYNFEYLTFKNPETGEEYQGMVDHPDIKILDILDDPEKFLRFLFGENSFLITGNDNSEDFDNFIENNITHDEWMDLDDYAKNPDREYDIYYKGN